MNSSSGSGRFRLGSVTQIDCAVKKEWMEREWKYKETTSDEKMYTGRSYPAREYLHTITLRDGRTITGPLAEIVYVQPQDDSSKTTREGPPNQRLSGSC